MEQQLNNPLRPTTRQIRSDQRSGSQPDSNPSVKRATLEQQESKTNSHPPEMSKAIEPASALDPEVRKALDLINAPDEFRKLMLKLSETGIEITGPRKVFIKHSYEIEQDLHNRFHKMYPVLGYKKVKEAINDAISNWCDLHEVEFRRRSGASK